jgi:hypothetical protein
VKATKRPLPLVTTDGDRVVSHAGSYLLIELADRLGLTEALCHELRRLHSAATARGHGYQQTDSCTRASSRPAVTTFAPCSAAVPMTPS